MFLKNVKKFFISELPKVRGELIEDKDLSLISWLKVGGPAEIFFVPKDKDDLSLFLKNVSPNIPITVLGLCSNLIIRDGGIPGVVIKLGKNFNMISNDGNYISAGASVLDAKLSIYAANFGFDLSFLRTIPGTIGGAVKMNSGCYGTYMSEVIVSVKIMMRNGDIKDYNIEDINFGYRTSSLPKDSIILEVLLKPPKAEKNYILKKIKKNVDHRASTQPITSVNCGSTFLNPSGKSSLVENFEEKKPKAWQLIKQAGLSGHIIGGAKVSEKHSNFMINIGKAKAEDFEKLGNYIQKKVYEESNYLLEWEIKKIGIQAALK